MKNTLSRFLALLTFALLSATVSAQITVNIDFNSDSMLTYSGQGAYTEPGKDFWTGITDPTRSGSNFTASDGTTATNITFSIGATIGGFFTTAPPSFAVNLLSDYIYGNTLSAFTIGGLTPGNSYSFYLYSQVGGDLTALYATKFVFDGNTLTATGVRQTSFVEGQNFVRFDVTPTGTSLNGSVELAPGSTFFIFNGLQIVDRGVAAVPEPSTYAAITGLMALVGVVFFRRRRLKGLPPC